MRVIKFRAWHKLNQQMCYMGWNGDNYYDIATLFGLGESAEIMQFTGLTDKNGKEIYEGDICFTESKEYPRNKLVKWNNQTACFEFDYPIGKSLLQKNDIEVIGNIYENPNLLQ